ncbi:hypothetical protein LTR15_008890 [Elasticomyces elasticus]|nr:hypothetical protein LTR15_008890 [Elasticomyces elasticus]
MAAYTINVSEEKIVQLKEKLSQASFPDELEGSGHDLGAPLADVRRLTKAWETFDWKAQETKLNSLPNYHTPIKADGFPELDIHFIHQRSDSPDAIPLLFCHGWPGSYIEVTKMLALLKSSSNGVSFHVVAPSLPNFGWSEGPKQRGFGLSVVDLLEACSTVKLTLRRVTGSSMLKSTIASCNSWGTTSM